MTVSLKHAFTSAIADSGDTTLVQPSNWNAEHNLTMATNALLGRTTAGTGTVEEISVSTGLSFSAGVLSVGATTPQTDTTNTFTASQIISVTDNTNAALRITQLGTGESIRVEDSTNPDATPFVVTATGAVGIGTASPSTILHAQVLGGTSNGLQLTTEGNTLFNSLAYTDSATNWSRFYRYRGTTSAPTIVASGDTIKLDYYYGYDGANIQTAAALAVKVDGTPGVGDMPGRIEFYTTPDGSASLVERMRIRNDGGVGIGSAGASSVGLYVGKNITGATTAYGITTQSTVQPDVTTQANYFYTGAFTAANGGTPYTVGTLNHYAAVQGTFNADSTVSSQIGYSSGATLIGATNNYAFLAGNTAAVTTGKTAYGFYSNVNTATGGGTTYGFYAAGTANNVMPNLSGGIAASSTLTLQSTTGAGTTDAIIFKTASQTERFRIDTSGALGIGGANYGTSGQVLTSGGSGAPPTWSSISGAAVTSLSFGTTGLTPSTATQGAITVGGTLAVGSGGTGGTTASAARTNLAAAGTGDANTFTANQIISVTDNTNAALRITQLGTGEAIRVEDSTNPDATAFVIDANGVMTTGGNATIGGTATINGNVSLPAATTESRFIELGAGRTGNGNAFIDFVGDTTYTDYGLRLIRGATGPNASSQIAHRGTGIFSIYCPEAATVDIYTTNAQRFVFGPSGQFGIGGANYGTSGQIMISGGASAAPSWSSTLTNPTLTGFTETVYAVSGTTPALSPNNGTVQTWTLTGSSTPTAGTWASGQSITLMVDDGTAYTITWTSLPVTWVGGSAPTLATTGYTIIELWKVSTTIYGALVGTA